MPAEGLEGFFALPSLGFPHFGLGGTDYGQGLEALSAPES